MAKQRREEGEGIPNWLPPALYAVLTIFLFREFVFSRDMLYGSDTVALGYMAREFYANAVKGPGGFPFWNPIILGGTPFIESLAGRRLALPAQRDPPDAAGPSTAPWAGNWSCMFS